MNAVIEKWRSYNAVKEPLDKLCKKRKELSEQMGLREFDVNQHLVRTLSSDGTDSQIKIAREHILEIVSTLEDRGVICELYRSLYNLLEVSKTIRYQDILAMKVSNSNAEVDFKISELTDAVNALQAEKKVCDAYITKYKKRNWWQRLWNKDVDMYEERGVAESK